MVEKVARLEGFEGTEVHMVRYILLMKDVCAHLPHLFRVRKELPREDALAREPCASHQHFDC